MDVFELIGALGEAQRRADGVEFVAPRVRRGVIRVRVEGVVRELSPTPADAQGWGVWRAEGRRAEWVRGAGLGEVDRYVEGLPGLRVWLARRLSGSTWLACPANASDMAQRFGRAHPVVVHLVGEGARFERVVARCDGASWWFHELDCRPDPRISEALRAALVAEEESPRVAGATPELRGAYGVAFEEVVLARRVRAEREARRGRRGLERAFADAGGRVRDAVERDGEWSVTWVAPGGEVHHSVVRACDMGVVSAGICLAGEDEKFDVRSLVGVVEGQWEEW